VIALSLMAFVLLLLLGMVALTQVETQTASSTLRMNEARANAILGLQVGLGELQRLSGPDTRVTARAEILGLDDSSPYRYWTGVWDSRDADPDTARMDHSARRAYDPSDRKTGVAWLVSGLDGERPEEIDPELIKIPADQQVELMSGDSDENIPEVIAGKQTIANAPTQNSGSYAWWVGDEGVKARINLRDPLQRGQAAFEDLVGVGFSFGNDAEKRQLLSASLAQKHGVEHVDALSQALQDDTVRDALSRIISDESLETLLESSGVVDDVPYAAIRHDLTTNSRGLLTDVRKGGFKKDLTLAFNDADVFEQYFGMRPSPASVSPNSLQPLYAQSYNFSGIEDHFYLTPEIAAVNDPSTSVESLWGNLYGVGPNWGTLFHFYHLYELPGISAGGIPPIAPWPYADRRSPVRLSSYPPYSNFQDPNFEWEQDGQHFNNPIGPVLERIKFIVRVGAVESTDADTGETRYKLRFYMQPLVGLWNPYNIKLTQAFSNYYRYRIDCEAAPEFVISGTYADGTEFTETVNLARGYGHSDYQGTEGFWSLLFPDDVDLEPGEIRLFSTTSSGSSEIEVIGSGLDYGWEESEGFYVDWPYDPLADGNIYNDDDPAYLSNAEVTIHSVTFKDRTDSSSSSNYAGAFFVLKHTLPGNDADTGHFQRIGAIWKDSLYNGGTNEPGGVTDGTIAPFQPTSVLGGNYQDIGAWLFHLRTTQEDTQGIRNVVDSNLRSLAGSARWDGPELFAMAPFAASEDHGYLAPGSAVAPVFGEYEPRFTGINGASIDYYGEGISNIALFDVPRAPLVSVGQFQHAHLARYSFEPTYLVGNSYANPRVPLDAVVRMDFDGQSDVNLFDTAYLVNDAIFDEYFFSTFDPGSSDADLLDLRQHAKQLYNTRYQLVMPFDSDLEGMLDSEEKVDAWGGRFMVEGAFNVNSTSVNAWKAVLGSMDQPFLRTELDGALTEEVPDGVYVSRMSLPIFDSHYMGDTTLRELFQGARKLSNDELQALAEAIVEEVRVRGPFLSMADFVNRRLEGSRAQQQRGALQAALDRTINQNIAQSLTGEPADLTGSEYSDAFQTSGAWTDRQAAGAPGYTQQGDLLQVLAPVLSVRSDTFVIRSYGSVESLTGESTEVWCEAVVQRVPDMVGTGNDMSDLSVAEMGREARDLSNEFNQEFGRSYRIVGFRWLNKDEI
tara:strand:- start:7318 stop:10863 length:3546 start_codon:yes stop_codon:yes gene_type:complete